MLPALPSFVSDPNPEIYLSDNYVILDFETTNFEHGSALDSRNSLILACWRVGKKHADYGRVRDSSQWGDEFGQSRLLEACASADYIVAHNGKFELAWLKRCGLDLRSARSYCSMIGEKVIAGNREFSLSLQASAIRRGLGTKDSVVSALISGGVCPSQIPHKLLESYCRQDVALTEALFLEQRKELKALGLLPVAYCRNLVTPVLADIEFNGMTLDATRVWITFAEYGEKYALLQEKFSELTGGINVKSPKQMAEYMYCTLAFEELTNYKGQILKTPSGAPLTDKLTIGKLEAKTPEQRAFMKVAKELIKLKTPLQNLTKMAKICKESPDDPRVFATFNQTVTQTDRLSSTSRNGGFQFQNFDRSFKPLFQARGTGRVICEGDASQLEFRVAAHLGDDAYAKSDIQEGVDVHSITAATLGCDRQTAKAFTFKPLYGGTSGTPRQRKYYDYFKQRYSGVSGTQNRWALDAALRKQQVTPWGLIFYWPDAELKDKGYVKGQTQIYNYPIQSLATADIIPLALVLLWHSIADLDATIISTIHDSIVADVAEEALPEYQRRLIDALTNDIYSMLEKLYAMKFSVPLACGVKAAEHWGEGEESQFESTVYSVSK